MGRTACPSCGATVDVAEDIDTGEKVAIEVNTDASSDADRYRIVDLNPLKVQKVSPGQVGDYFPAHLFDCPAHGAGLVGRG